MLRIYDPADADLKLTWSQDMRTITDVGRRSGHENKTVDTKTVLALCLLSWSQDTRTRRYIDTRPKTILEKR